MNLSSLPLLDLIALGIVAIACLRGLWIGLIREGLSLATVGFATIVTRLYVTSVSGWLTSQSGGELTGRTSLWIAGVLLVLATIAVLAVVGRILRRSAAAVGLGWADRMGGGALGAAEGTIVASILVVIALWLVGPNHASTQGAHCVEVVEQLQSWRETGDLPAVASPGNWQ
jgi:membrane protein required for colicin V production